MINDIFELVNVMKNRGVNFINLSFSYQSYIEDYCISINAFKDSELIDTYEYIWGVDYDTCMDELDSIKEILKNHFIVKVDKYTLDRIDLYKSLNMDSIHSDSCKFLDLFFLDYGFNIFLDSANTYVLVDCNFEIVDTNKDLKHLIYNQFNSIVKSMGINDNFNYDFTIATVKALAFLQS